MNRSWAGLLAGVGLLCLGTIIAVTTILPSGGIAPHWAPYLRLAPRPGPIPILGHPNPARPFTWEELRQRFGLPLNLAPVRLAREPEEQTSSRLPLGPFGVHRSGLGGVALYLGSLLAFASLGMICLYLFPRRLQHLSQSLGQSWAAFGEAGLLGLAGYLFLAVLGVLLTLTVVGIPLALLLGVVVAGLSFLALVAAASLVGQRLAGLLGVGGGSAPLWWMAGLLPLFALGILPVVGWFVVALAVIFGFGAVLRTRFGGESAASLSSEAQTESSFRG